MNLDKLKSLMNHDERMVDQFLDIFRNEIPRQLDDLNNAIENEDWRNASTIAHGIKSQVKYLDLSKIADMAYRIERNAENESDLDYMFDDFDDLERALLDVLDEL